MLSLCISNIEPRGNFNVVFKPFDYDKCNDNRCLQNGLGVAFENKISKVWAFDK